ncbi:hypothetical protein PVAND_004877 [Polypedilum vanderplanki]|uniref:Uncharacterized protein n=1 Tax=Polypedilum vanderplanki TaxID=319348 RepID=A0A9J6BZE0_POLVA|nr:hypothetical protein PVAND_004877 [Polypedilum vanderplanki]
MAKNKAQKKGNEKFKKNKNHNVNTNKKKSSKMSKDSDNKKINYVLNPRILKKKEIEQKQKVQREKMKSIQTKKRKRNAIFMKTTDKGQPKLNARMKVLYDQIARSCGKET